MVFCGVYAHNTPKTPDFTLFHSYYIIETHNSDSTMKKKITNRVSLPVESLLKEATEQTLLTVEQEVELANRIKQGDDEALMDLYNCNLRFVVSVAKQYQDRGLTMEELVEAGKEGLKIACKKFDPSRKFKFISYAVWYIRQAIQQAISEHSDNE